MRSLLLRASRLSVTAFQLLLNLHTDTDTGKLELFIVFLLKSRMRLVIGFYLILRRFLHYRTLRIKYFVKIVF